jgi:hypothetical protein
MSEQDHLRALLLCSAIIETAKKLEADFAKLKQAANDFRTDFERWQKEHTPSTPNARSPVHYR